MIKIKEIGSEFWTKNPNLNCDLPGNEKHLLSGRTALNYIIEEIKKSKQIKKAMLPAYCCNSMIMPFLEQGIEVQFYSVEIGSVDYCYSNDVDVVLLVDFFGYVNFQNIEIAKTERLKGKTIIYDFTHKIDRNIALEEFVDYSFCSYRKWLYCNDAVAIKHSGNFVNNSKLLFNDRYVEIREDACNLKNEYMNGLSENKADFLKKYNLAETILENDYKNYVGIPCKIDVLDIVSKRRENAKFIIDKLKNCKNISLWKSDIDDCDCPMFVPIFLEKHLRDRLRLVLIKNDIYCPIHWAKPECVVNNGWIYDKELSLICDQRYSINDLDRMLNLVVDTIN